MARIRYEIDPHNRLVARETGEKSEVSGFRHVIDGRFKIGKGNTLEYHVKAASGGAAAPHQLRLRGDWSLTDRHALRLTLNKWGRQTFGDELTLRGEVIKADSGSLSFAMIQRTKEGALSTYILKLEGKWQADKRNRLTFRAKKEKAGYDVLTFDGIWELDRRHKIVYSYEAGSGGRAEKRSLVLDGFWDFSGKGVITYYLDLKGGSRFDFRIGKGIAKKDSIIFEVGIGVSRKERPVSKNLIFYGKWRIRSGTGLAFELEYGDGSFSDLKFEAEARLAGNAGMKFALRSETGRDLGIELTLSRSMLKGCGESFIRLLRSSKERAVYIGSGFTW